MYPGRFCSLWVDESLSLREGAVGGAGTWRFDWSDMDTDEEIVPDAKEDRQGGE
jgi:hypothetical protein